MNMSIILHAFGPKFMYLVGRKQKDVIASLEAAFVLQTGCKAQNTIFDLTKSQLSASDDIDEERTVVGYVESVLKEKIDHVAFWLLDGCVAGMKDHF